MAASGKGNQSFNTKAPFQYVSNCSIKHAFLPRHITQKTESLTSHGILHYLCSADLSKTFIHLILLVLSFPNIFFHRFYPVEKCRYSVFINFNLHVIGPWCSFKNNFHIHMWCSVSVFTLFSCGKKCQRKLLNLYFSF